MKCTLHGPSDAELSIREEFQCGALMLPTPISLLQPMQLFGKVFLLAL